MNPAEQFAQEVKANIQGLAQDEEIQALSKEWITKIGPHKYAYNFRWMGRPIIQVPQDVMAMQELIFSIQPDLIIETGIAHGGSLVFSAAMLELNAACGGPPDAEVLGIDIDIRAHNRQAIETHPMFKRITLLQGSSIDEAIIGQVKEIAATKKRILVCLDSNHTHAHVLAELQAYAQLTSVGSYCVVFDTVVEDLPKDQFPDRPWGPGDNPKTAVWEYLKGHPEFEIDTDIHHKLLITVAPDGYLKRVR
ncbi:cephalosporin hydroxylase [Herbaspirillum rubrisubalbicans]|uniref:Cephalosporin hydroxylase n=1 Tax=Herbaspirillum rubrisubalbicans TaxID=80842 RepID=A0ABX9BZV6_9BURK|nr:cephalosporin hydroxylase family protein [Herbaspirillum rubrisubalbicans]RAM63598.1 cephalosporin hydroxylase [Herbaspirillum rubrisubalbicans]RAN48612.1 cephalosporin hydroxylase [Herbaspirillum rubrisubalbicans]